MFLDRESACIRPLPNGNIPARNRLVIHLVSAGYVENPFRSVMLESVLILKLLYCRKFANPETHSVASLTRSLSFCGFAPARARRCPSVRPAIQDSTVPTLMSL